ADSRPKTRRKPCGHGKRSADTGEASGPSQAVYKLPVNRAANQATEKIAAEIGPACYAAVFSGRPSDKAGSSGLREERSNPDQDHAGEHFEKMQGQHQRQADCRNRKRAPDRRPRPESRDGSAGKKSRHDGGQEDNINKSQIHSSQGKRRTHEYKVHEGERPDEGE